MSVCKPRHCRSFCILEGLASSLWKEVMKPPPSFTQGRFCHQPPTCPPDPSIHTQTDSTSSVVCTWPWLRQVNRTVEKGVKLTNDQDDSHAPSVPTCHVKQRHRLLIVQMQEKRGPRDTILWHWLDLHPLSDSLPHAKFTVCTSVCKQSDRLTLM